MSDLIIEKPPVGMACNGCGFCCKAEVCSTGSYLMKLVKTLGERAPGPCPALVAQDNKYVCELLMYPKKYIKSHHSTERLREAIGITIGAGKGCDELGDSPTPDDEAKLDEMITKMQEPEEQWNIMNAVKVLYNR